MSRSHQRFDSLNLVTGCFTHCQDAKQEAPAGQEAAVKAKLICLTTLSVLQHELISRSTIRSAATCTLSLTVIRLIAQYIGYCVCVSLQHLEPDVQCKIQCRAGITGKSSCDISVIVLLLLFLPMQSSAYLLSLVSVMPLACSGCSVILSFDFVST